MTSLRWDDCDSYEPGFKLGSEGENGEHIRDDSGWPYSIYRRAVEIGCCDVVICNGIQSKDDAVQILDRLQALAQPRLIPESIGRCEVRRLHTGLIVCAPHNRKGKNSHGQAQSDCR